jgi:hypothetical protein
MDIVYKLSINGGPLKTFDSLGLSNPRITQGNFVSDMMEIEHPSAAWDGPALFAYRDDVTVWQLKDGVSTRVFRGKRLLAPRFKGAQAERISYTFDGPFGWLMKRDLLQNAAVPPSEGEGPPVPVAQGLVILGQDDSGATVQVSQSILTFVNAAIAAGVPVTLGTITGLDLATGWDWIRDIKIGEAIMRVLQTVPDAFCVVDYSTAAPTLNFIRAAWLQVATLPMAPAGTPVAQFGDGGYAEFESISLVDRPDMVVPGVWVSFRSIDTTNGEPKLRITTIAETAPGAQRTDENALNRTVELAGAVTSTNTLSQDCVTEIIPVRLAGEGETDPITPDAGTDFAAVVKFLARSEGWMSHPGTTITKLTPSGAHSANSTVRRALEPNNEGEMVEVFYDSSLTRELISGSITPWMKSGGLNRKSQEQEVGYEVEAIRMIDGVNVPWNGTVTRAFRATNVSTRTYEFTEAPDFTPPEPIPEGLVPVLYDSLKTKKWEGTLTLVQRQCTMSLRPGWSVNITGGLADWTSMAAWVQSAVFDLQSGRTVVTLGFAKALGIDDLIGSWRSNRNRQPAERGLMRTTGLF